MSVNKKRGSGRNKARARKREYAAHCRIMRINGWVTDHLGNWHNNPKSLGLSEAAVRATTGR